MTRPLRFAAALVLVAACAQAPAEEQPEEQPQEQTTRRIPQFENEHVEVWKSIIMPHQPLSMHRHDNPRAIIALRGGTLRVVNEAGESRDMTWDTGTTSSTPRQSSTPSQSGDGRASFTSRAAGARTFRRNANWEQEGCPSFTNRRRSTRRSGCWASTRTHGASPAGPRWWP